MTGIKYMDLNEFMDIGFLQEANRQFFHPLGLALEVSSSGGEEYDTLKVWDYRQDPEGNLYGEGVISQDKIDRVEAEWIKHTDKRIEIMGSVIQGVNDTELPGTPWTG